MIKKIIKPDSLRIKAEEMLKNKTSNQEPQLSDVEYRRLIYELKIHQIELEIQNEELLQTQAAEETANEKYIRLYDFAPSGNFTISGKGEIIQLNLTGAMMLGKDRQHLKNRLFQFFVSEDTKPVFSLFLEKMFRSKTKETCEIKLKTNGNFPTYVLLTGIIAENQEQCNVTVVDITERRVAQDALLASEKRYRTTIEIEPYINWYDVRVYPGTEGISVFFTVITDKKKAESHI